MPPPAMRQAKQPRTLKGLQEMRTSAAAAAVASGGPDVLPHKLHMRLCALEMERHRRDQERRVAMERAAKCESRCAAIEREVQLLLEALRSRVPAPAVTVRRGGPLGPLGPLGPAAARAQEVKPLTHRY